MQLTCGGNDVVRYLVGIGLLCVYVLFMLFFYHCFIASIAFIILPMYYRRFSVWNKTWLIDWNEANGSPYIFTGSLQM